MTKREAIEKFVERDFHPVPQEWVKIIAEANDEFPSLPMWGTMWIVDQHLGERLMAHSRLMASEASELVYSDNVEEQEGIKAKVEQAIKDGDFTFLEEYVSEEMAGEHCVLDKEGKTTAVYIYEVGDEYVIGVHGAGWNFYDGVWDKLYDLLGLEWHEVDTITESEVVRDDNGDEVEQ